MFALAVGLLAFAVGFEVDVRVVATLTALCWLFWREGDGVFELDGWVEGFRELEDGEFDF